MPSGTMKAGVRGCFLVIFVALPALAQRAEPRVIDRTAPEYTTEARTARLEGSALVTVVVDGDGTLRDVHISRPLGLGLDKNAVETVRQWQFAPAYEGEKPVEAVAHVEVNFRMLIGRDDWYLSGVQFETPANATRPVIQSAPYADRDKTAGPAAITASFTIDPRGEPGDIQIEKSSGESAAREVAQFLSGWRFRPAMADGHPVAAHCVMNFAAGAALLSESLPGIH